MQNLDPNKDPFDQILGELPPEAESEPFELQETPYAGEINAAWHEREIERRHWEQALEPIWGC